MIWLWLILFVTILLFGFSVFRGSPYVPSHRSDIILAFSELYHLKKNDTLVDIGSGDGIVLREAAKKGATAVGYEINPMLVLISRILSRKYKKVKIVLADFWFSSLPPSTTVVYVFSVTRDIKNITKRIQSETNKIGRPVYLISYATRLGNRKVIKSLGAHHLYLFHPLQSDKAQV